ncbi:hypothetical protein CEXT_214311 [Caerostris extrusa]|uniref:Uncharacterized protein n=1 Tax=Caerostris extrusa TaxID=172846 RepID=A0AAV4N892_CAEEX|nr:hypothetical protein CEXT_214311 [Caerostris extrusa]
MLQKSTIFSHSDVNSSSEKGTATFKKQTRQPRLNDVVQEDLRKIDQMSIIIVSPNSHDGYSREDNIEAHVHMRFENALMVILRIVFYKKKEPKENTPTHLNIVRIQPSKLCPYAILCAHIIARKPVPFWYRWVPLGHSTRSAWDIL